MTETTSRRIVTAIENIALAASYALMCIGVWAMGRYALGMWSPETIARSAPANPASILLAGCIAVTVILRIRVSRGFGGAAAGKVIAGIVIVLSGIKLLGIIGGVDVHFDRILFPSQMDTVPPNRMAFNAALAFLALGTSLLLQLMERWHKLADSLAFAGFLMSFLSLVGFAYGERSLFGLLWERPLSAHAVAGLMLLSVGTLLARPRAGLTAILADGGAAGVAARWLLPMALATPFLSGLLFAAKPEHLQLAYVTVTCAVVFCAILAFAIGKLLAVDRQRQRAMDELRDIEKLRQDFLFRTIHNLRSPTHIMQSALAVHVEASGGNGSKDKTLGYLQDASVRIAELINDLMAVAKGADPNFKLAKEAIDLQPMLDSLLRGMATLAAGRRIVIEQVRLSEPAAVAADATALGEVLDNLVGNSIKYGKDGGRVRVIQEERGEMLEITVWDDGIGISQENLHLIFEPYFRVQGTGRPGTGLGLYIVRQLVEKMGGTVRCESEYGKWTAFTFSLPLA